MKAEFRVVVAGSRDYHDYNFVRRKLMSLLREKKKTHSIIILSGKCTGADALGEMFANENGFQVEPYPAAWYDENGKLDRSAGPRRNREMAKAADAAVVFWSGDKESGSWNMINEMGKLQKLCRAYMH